MLAYSDILHAEKYRQENEPTFEHKCRRVSRALCDGEHHYRRYFDITNSGRFWEAGRVQASMGTDKCVTAANCFVSGDIADTYCDKNGIMDRAKEAAATMRQGGGIGYDFSTLRPQGALIKGLNSHSSGPISFMKIFDAVCQATSSTGHRRGAQMGVLRVDHPDIQTFVEAKTNTTELTGFNISVGITDVFMHALINNQPFDLVFEGKVYKTIDPAALWNSIMETTWDWAEPGVLFLDTINRMNNLKGLEVLKTSNPCAEQPLPSYGCCILGSFRLPSYVSGPSNDRYFDYGLLASDILPVVRAMDNIIDRSNFPLVEQYDEAQSKRRMGLGVMGTANAGEALGLPYASPEFCRWFGDVLKLINDQCYSASARLAREKGRFPLFNKEKYLSSEFLKIVDDGVKDDIKRYGIRNSHLTSIAPTGTISFCADYISSGIEPVYGFEQQDGSYGYEGTRLVNTPDGQIEVLVSDFGYREFGVKGRVAQEISPQEHLDVLKTAYKYVDSAVSKTVNTDSSFGFEAFKDLYLEAWRSGCKGLATFNSDGKRMGILRGVAEDSEDEEEGLACYIDPQTGVKTCDE